MPVHDNLGTRMKEYYEAIPKVRLMRRTPVAIRIDGKAFHTFTRGFAKPFDKVLSRDTLNDEWIIGFYSHISTTEWPGKYITDCGIWNMCIPYEGNEHLLGTTNEPNDFFVTWE